MPCLQASAMYRFRSYRVIVRMTCPICAQAVSIISCSLRWPSTHVEMLPPTIRPERTSESVDPYRAPLHANRLDSPAGLVPGQGAIFTASPMSHLRSVPAQAAVSFWGKSRKGRDQGRGSDQHGTLDMVGHGWTSLQAEHFIKLSMFCAGTCLSGADLAAQITGRLK